MEEIFMERRSDKYLNTDVENVSEKSSRVQKNHHLYDELNHKIGYEEIPTIENDQIDLSSFDFQNPSRSDYQKIKDYKELLSEKSVSFEKKEETETKPKNFDINVVLEEAKKNRKTVDALEEKRNLKDEEYSVLSNLNKKYLHKKDFTEEDDGELKELIHTITSKTLAGDIKDAEEKELLSDLLATTIDIQLENELSTSEIQKLYEDAKDSSDDSEDTTQYENSFYTKSMELSREDLLEEESEEGEEEESHSTWKVVLLTFLLLAVLTVVIYFLLKHFGIAFN